MDMAPTSFMGFFRYPDRPGMIGKVGTILGGEGINIAAMQVGRTEAGGTALMGLNVDSSLTHELLDRITEEAGMDEAWSVEL